MNEYQCWIEEFEEIEEDTELREPITAEDPVTAAIIYSEQYDYDAGDYPIATGICPTTIQVKKMGTGIVKEIRIKGETRMSYYECLK